VVISFVRLNRWGYQIGLLFIFLIPFIAVACSQQLTETPVEPVRSTKDAEENITLPTQDPFLQERQEMVADTIEARGISDPDVLRAMRTVPRHEFVPEDSQNLSYIDSPLPIGYGQTISQPYIVAWMTELLALERGEKVLEIGTGSGYQAAVLAELGGIEVYTIEIVPELAESAASRLSRLGYEGVVSQSGDGYFGWTDYAPFNAIIVTAAPDHLPPFLVEQLTDDGRLVIPIGPPGSIQTMWKFVLEGGELKGYNLGAVRFVPFTGEIQDRSSGP